MTSLIGQTPPNPVAFNGEPLSLKSRTAALVLCLFLGALGIHRFYVDKTGTALLMLLLFLTGLSLLWACVDVVLIIFGWFRDKNGLRVAVW